MPYCMFETHAAKEREWKVGGNEQSEDETYIATAGSKKLAPQTPCSAVA